MFLYASLDYTFEEFGPGSLGRASKWFGLAPVPLGMRRIEVTFTQDLSPALLSMIKASLRDMSRNFDFSIQTLRLCRISRETPVTEPFYETKDLLKELGFVKRRWSVAEVLVKLHQIDYCKAEQMLEERAHLLESVPNRSVALGAIFKSHLSILFFAGVGVDPLEMAAAASRQ